MWDYAQLTKAAAEFGGPKDYIDAIETFAYTEASSVESRKVPAWSL